MIKAYRYAGEDNFLIEVVRSKRKSIGLEIKPDGRVIARAPMRLSNKDLVAFLEKHKDWVYNHLERRNERRERSVKFPDYDKLSVSEKNTIRKKLYEKACFYSEIMGVTFGRIAVRNQKTRWGSCSSKGNLNFNYRLYYLPERLMDYVVVHELAHRIHMDHSREFWYEVEKIVPDYRERRKALKDVF